MLYRRDGSAHWWHDFYVDGVRYRGSCKTRDKRTAAKVEEEKRTQIVRRNHTGVREPITLGEAIAFYWDFEGGKESASYQTLVGYFKRFVKEFGEDTRLHQIRSSHIMDFVSAMRDDGLANATINRHIAHLRRLFNLASKKWKRDVGDPPDWPTFFLPEPDGRHREHVLSEEEEERLLEELHPEVRPIVEFALLTGLRYSNIVNMDWSQVQWSANRIVFRVKSKRPGGKVHVLPITSSIKEFLEEIGPKKAGPVFVRESGEKIKSMHRAWKNAVRRSGIDARFRFHDLRHTAASRMLRRGAPLDVVQAVLGHENITTTQRYATRREEEVATALTKLTKSPHAPDSTITGETDKGVEASI